MMKADILKQIKGLIEHSRQILVQIYLNKRGIDFIQCKINYIHCLWTTQCTGLQFPKLKNQQISYKFSLFAKRSFIRLLAIRGRVIWRDEKKEKRLNWKTGFDLEMTQQFPIIMLLALGPVLFPHSFSNFLTSETDNLILWLRSFKRTLSLISRQTLQHGVLGPPWTPHSKPIFVFDGGEDDVTPHGSACGYQHDHLQL